jgi:beta-hydroxylase
MVLYFGLGLFFIFVTSSITYVYAYRGQQRFDSFNEYLRKGWPIFTPLNCLLYVFTQKRAQKAIIAVHDFPELKVIQDQWEVISKEAQNLLAKGYFDQTTNPDNNAYYDIGFRTFYKYGWSKFYLKWYGYTHASALQHCPNTVEILKGVKSVNGAMFSYLPVGSQLTRHLDPVACSLRYHLGLKTPESDECFINVDGQNYSWRDGEGFIFDETYLHFAKNESQKPRLILMCDVERPMFLIGPFINFIYKIAMRMSIVPNTAEDQRGFANKTFAFLSPLLKKTKALKQSNPLAYKFVKHGVNLTLFLVLMGLVVSVLMFLRYLF